MTFCSHLFPFRSPNLPPASRTPLPRSLPTKASYQPTSPLPSLTLSPLCPSLPRNLTSLLLLSTSLHHHRASITKKPGVREERSTIHTPFSVSSSRSIPLLAPPCHPKNKGGASTSRLLLPSPLPGPTTTNTTIYDRLPAPVWDRKICILYLQTTSSTSKTFTHHPHSRPPW